MPAGKAAGKNQPFANDQIRAATSPIKPISMGKIAISDKNEIWINRRLVDMDAVQANIEKLHAENPQGGAVIQADERSQVGLMVEVIDAVRLAGVEQYSIAASEKN